MEERHLLIKANTTETKALLTVKELCTYLGIGQTKSRELLSDPANGFTVKIGNHLYAHKAEREDRSDTHNDDELPMWLQMCDHVGNDYVELCPVPVRLKNCGR